MPGLLQLTKPESVEAAISEYVELGRDEFLRKYGSSALAYVQCCVKSRTNRAPRC